MRRGLPVVLACCAVALVGCDDRGVEPRCAPLRIMPLGDSITEAEGGYASYRYWLHDALARRGVRFDFVGSSSGVYRGAPRFEDFDADHEGHWGITTDEVRRYVDRWAARSRPDLVLLQLGTNDGARDLDATSANLAAIVESLRAHRPGVDVLLAQVPPVGDPRTGALWPEVRALNRAIADVAERLDLPAERVVLVDQYTGFDVTRDSYDGVHPNEAGERKLAARWLAAIDALAPWNADGCPAP